MKIYKLLFPRWIYAIALLFLYGCSISAPQSADQASTLTPTAQSSPTQTPAPTYTPTNTPTSIPATKTLTPFPPLATEELENKIFELLRTNNGCELPCWWGITPGETRWEDAERLLLYLRFRVSLPDRVKLINHFSMFEGENIPILFIGFVELESGVIDAMIVQTGGGIIISRSFQEDWARYDPAKIIARYGVPSRVIVRSASLVPEPPVPITKPYSIYFFYDELGFYIRYDGEVAFKSVYRFCPSFGPGGNLKDQIEIAISQINGTNSLDELTSGMLIYPKFHKALEDITDLSVEEFAELYSGNEPVCFETPRDIWP